MSKFKWERGDGLVNMVLWSSSFSLINNYQQFRFNWSVWLEIDSGIVSCFGAVKFSSGGQHSWSWLEVSETKHNEMWSGLAGRALHPWHPWYPLTLLRLRFLQKHLLDWVSWQSGTVRAESDISAWREVWPVRPVFVSPQSSQWLMVSVNISLHPVTINPANVNKFSTKF